MPSEQGRARGAGEKAQRHPDRHALRMDRVHCYSRSVYRAAAVMAVAWGHKIGHSGAGAGSWLAPPFGPLDDDHARIGLLASASEAAAFSNLRQKYLIITSQSKFSAFCDRSVCWRSALTSPRSCRACLSTRRAVLGIRYLRILTLGPTIATQHSQDTQSPIMDDHSKKLITDAFGLNNDLRRRAIDASGMLSI